MPLVWTRVRDGEHNGKPSYEYHATAHDRAYHIVWAYDHGGTFGFTAIQKRGGENIYLTERHGIQWWGTLKRCKEQCEKIETEIAKCSP